MIARQLNRQVNALPRSVRYLQSSRVCQVSSNRSGPTHDSRTSPHSDSQPSHPGYTPASTPVSSAHPSTMPGISSTAKIAGNTVQASTRASPPHSGIHDMAKGAESGGSGAVTPEERNVKGWGPNSVTPESNTSEGRRNPVLDGGSNEGGLDSKGNSKT